jgi:hypothetical protein
MSTIYAAHIITVESTGLGDPEILIMTPDEGFGATIVEAIEASMDITLTDALDTLEDKGYRFPKHPTQVQPGYWVIDAVKD